MPSIKADLAVASVVSILVWRWFSRRARQKLPKFGGQEEVTAPSGQLEPFAVGEELVISFARQHFQWSQEHIPGSQIATWETRGDADGDAVLAHLKATSNSSKEFKDFLLELRLKEGSHVEELPEWLDEDLLQEGCDFFVTTWPLVFLCFSWALLGGFGAETAAAVLLDSRYWALKGENGQRDSFQRLQETVAWLYDMCAHGAHAFRPGGVAWEAALHVRYLHARTRAAVAGKEGWDANKNGVPINQAQLIGTLLGLSALILQGMEKTMGCAFRPRQRESFIHLWRVIGHLFGIEEALNPNSSFARACVSMESVFAFAIPTYPNPKTTGMLSKHMCETIARGLQEQYGVQVPPEHFAARARIYLGEAYCDAIGLPSVSLHHRLVAWSFTTYTKLLYLPYISLPFPIVARLYKTVMRAWFRKVVRTVRYKHERQGKSCRFGALASQQGDECPMKARHD